MSLRTVFVVAALTALSMPSTAAAANLPGTTQVNPSTDGDLGDALLPLAGSASWLVYQRSTQLVAHPTSETIATNFNVTVSDYPPSRVVEARSATGNVVAVTTSRVDDTGWSVASNILVATPDDGSHVDWWNLKTGEHGTKRLHGRHAGNLVSAAPGGFLYLTGSRHLERLNLASHRTRPYGRPIRQGITLGVAGPKGALVSLSGERARYVPYAHPHRWTTLATTATGGDPVQCTAVSSNFASCYRLSDDDDAAAPTADILVPLNGSKPHVSTICPGYPSIAGDTIVWAAADASFGGDGCATMPDGNVISFHHGSKHVRTSTTRVANVSTSAYGSAIFPGITEDSLLAATSAAHINPVLSSQKSPVSVGNFALSAGRISYADDEPDTSHPTHLVSVRARGLESDGSTITLGPPTVVNDDIDDAPISGSLVASSAATTAYLIDGPARHNHGLRIVGPAGTTTISGVAPFNVTVSGNRVLYLKDDSDGLHRWMLTDLRTGNTRDLGRPLNEGLGQHDYALWGNYLLSNTGSVVVRENLATGTQSTVATSSDPIYAVAEYGDNVAVELPADIKIYDVTAGTSTQVHIGRSGQSGHMTASPAGLVYADSNGFRLHEWSGNNIALLGFDSLWPDTAPKVDDRTLAWLDPNANLQVAPLNIPLAQPRFLGDPIAPATLAGGGSANWTTSVPYSAPLTSCTVTISQGATTVRTLPCAADQAAEGVAAVSWDGRDSDNHTVAAGDYTWTVSAAGTAGPALDAGGGNNPVSGTVTVTA